MYMFDDSAYLEWAKMSYNDVSKLRRNILPNTEDTKNTVGMSGWSEDYRIL